MKPGLQIGDQACITVKVTEDMFAQFNGEVVHRAYSTVSMLYHMEWASRKLILPYLEQDEEGMGAAVQLKHIAPSGEKAQLEIIATIEDMRRNYIMSQVVVNNEKGKIGEGKIKQVILPKEHIGRQLS
ncbi:thioesterase family protein [Lentibacillus juripiscarius]|uniref:Thioesterase family protein n=1 Tax=Lentibacillus juripiscarius TaxID=257446 RepID=A0ABW5V543_9BACI